MGETPERSSSRDRPGGGGAGGELQAEVAPRLAGLMDAGGVGADLDALLPRAIGGVDGVEQAQEVGAGEGFLERGEVRPIGLRGQDADRFGGVQRQPDTE